MAYFSNATEGDWYEQKICSRCYHHSDDSEKMCSVWFVHLMANAADEGSEVEAMLDALIPRQGIYNDLCTMFVPAKAEYADHGSEYKLWLAKRLEEEAMRKKSK